MYEFHDYQHVRAVRFPMPKDWMEGNPYEILMEVVRLFPEVRANRQNRFRTIQTTGGTYLDWIFHCPSSALPCPSVSRLLTQREEDTILPYFKKVLGDIDPTALRLVEYCLSTRYLPSDTYTCTGANTLAEGLSDQFLS